MPQILARLLLPVGVSVLLGWLALWPLRAVGHALRVGVLGAPEDQFLDNFGVVVTLAVLALLVFLTAFALLNLLLRRWSLVQGRRYWLIVSTAALIPLLIDVS